MSKQPRYKFLAMRIQKVAKPTTKQPDKQVTKAPTLKTTPVAQPRRSGAP